MGAGEFGADPAMPKAIDRFLVEAFGVVALAQQRARAGFDPERPSVPLASVISVIQAEASAAVSVIPLRAAASMSSAAAQFATPG